MTNMDTTRLARTLDNREAKSRPKKWQPASLLPEPDPMEGYVFRWIRVSMPSESDPRNVSSKMREGWEPVTAEEQPQFAAFADPKSRFDGGIEVGGLLLCKIPAEFMEQRKKHYSLNSQQQMDAVDNSFMQENNSKMPLFSERKTSTSASSSTSNSKSSSASSTSSFLIGMHQLSSLSRIQL